MGEALLAIDHSTGNAKNPIPANLHHCAFAFAQNPG
jgi:hypothetical protein